MLEGGLSQKACSGIRIQSKSRTGVCRTRPIDGFLRRTFRKKGKFSSQFSIKVSIKLCTYLRHCSRGQLLLASGSQQVEEPKEWESTKCINIEAAGLTLNSTVSLCPTILFQKGNNLHQRHAVSPSIGLLNSTLSLSPLRGPTCRLIWWPVGQARLANVLYPFTYSGRTSKLMKQTAELEKHQSRSLCFRCPIGRLTQWVAYSLSLSSAAPKLFLCWNFIIDFNLRPEQ